MRFVFISNLHGHVWGGSEELWSQAATRMCAECHTVAASVAWVPQLSPKIVKLAEEGIQVHVRLPAQNKFIRRVWLRLAGRQQLDYRWVKEQKPDLVVISHGGNGQDYEWMKYCREAGLPYVAILQCNAEEWWPQNDQVEEMRKAFSSALRVFCVSRRNLELLEQQIGASLSNAVVVWNPYNVSAGPTPPWPTGNGRYQLACVARLEPAAKGQDLLFQMLVRPQWRERPVDLNLYGTGSCDLSVRHLALHCGLNNVRFHGHVADVAGIWAVNHLLVLPSRYEGLPLALVESMWCGRPAVVTDIGGNAEVCLDGQTGFVAPAPTAGMLAETMERAWIQRDQWQSMGQAARRRAEQLIPKDPVADFCRLLLQSVAES